MTTRPLNTVAAPDALGGSRLRTVLSWVGVALLIYVLLAAVGAIGDGFKMAVGDGARDLFAFATNPMIALVVGVAATALTQSSSTVTSIIVGLVAGGLPLHMAIPMVMGANIGTSLTSTLVSLGSIRSGEDFKRAYSAATVHDMFNLLAVALLLPIEILFRPLARSSEWLAGLLVSDASVDMSGANFMKVMLSPASDALQAATAWIPGIWQGVALVAIGIALILWVVTAIGRLLRSLLVGRARDVMQRAVGRGTLSGMASGTALTVAVQSSSTTTALIVPMAASGVFSLKQVYPFVLGANIGTTVTALLAATAISGPTAGLALQIALVHLLFNVLAIALIYTLPVLRPLPPLAATRLAEGAQRSKWNVAAYIGGVFFVIPLVLIAGSTLL